MLKNIFSITLLFAFSANALLPYQEQKPNKSAEPFGEFGVAFDLTYQIGEEWGKLPVTAESLKDKSEAFQRAAMATAKVGGGTSFYLGVYNGKHIMATNHHVMPGPAYCGGRAIMFPLLGITLRCAGFIGHWTDIDLALFVLSTPTPEEAGALAKVARNFSFDRDLMKGQELITIGFGIADNPGRQLVANQDSDCRVFSMDADYRFLADPDDVNPGTYKAWSFANGCDVSHGDSGSAMVDRETGDVMGIIWTGRIPKDSKVQNAQYLIDIYQNNSDEVWKQLSYSVPAKKMGEHLAQVASDPNTSEDNAKTLKALLAH